MKELLLKRKAGWLWWYQPLTVALGKEAETDSVYLKPAWAT